MESQNKKYLNEFEVSEMTGIAVQTLRNKRFKREGIPYCKIFKRSVRYALNDVIDYMESRKIVFDTVD